MDSLILAQLLLKFLLVPESFLSVFFAILLLLTYYQGCRRISEIRLALRKMVDEAVLEYPRRTGLYHPLEYAKVVLKPLDEKEYAIHAVPNWLVSTGILATFLGLGVALREASDLIQGPQGLDVSKLNGVLSLIAFKFQTSVWGLALSILFQRLGLSAYISIRQQAEQVLIEELFRIKEHGLQDQLERQTVLLEALVEHAGQNAHTVKALEAAVESFGQGTAKMLVQVGSNLEKLMDRQLNRLETMNQQSLDLQRQNGQVLAQNLSALSLTITEQLQKMQIRLAELQEAANQATAAQIEKISETFLAGLTEMRKAGIEFNEQSLAIQQASGQSIWKLSQASEHLEQGISEGLQAIVNQLQNLGDYVNDFDSTNQVVLKMISQLKDEIRRVTDVFEHLSAIESERELAQDEENSAVRLFINPFDALRGQTKEGS